MTVSLNGYMLVGMQYYVNCIGFHIYEPQNESMNH